MDHCPSSSSLREEDDLTGYGPLLEEDVQKSYEEVQIIEAPIEKVDNFPIVEIKSPSKIRHVGRLIRNAQLYREPTGVSKTVTYPVDTAPDGKECDPSAWDKSDGSMGVTGKKLRNLTLMIGQKLMRFKVVDAAIEDMTEWVVDDNEEIFECTECHSRFQAKEQLRHHMSVHNTSARMYQCAYCDKSFNTAGYLKVHMRTHSSSDRSHMCPICFKRFTWQPNLNMHMKLHQSGRRFFCSICGKCFKTTEEMTAHRTLCMNHMEGEFVNTDRPMRYQCTFCDKWFHHRRDKTIHERVHTGERPYTCGYCGRGFSQSQALTIHIRTHTGERPYICSICGRHFRDSSALRKHEFSRHLNASPSMFNSPPTRASDALMLSYEQEYMG